LPIFKKFLDDTENKVKIIFVFGNVDFLKEEKPIKQLLSKKENENIILLVNEKKKIKFSG
jgi:predicted phosphodiesterase